MEITVFLVLSLVLFGLVQRSRIEARRFLVAHETIDSSMALDAFKALARRNMVFAIVALPLGLVLIGLVVHLALMLQMVGVAVAVAVFFLLTRLSKNLLALEKRTRGLDCANAELLEEHLRVGHSWRKKVFPDF